MTLPGPVLGLLGVVAQSRDMASHTTAGLSWADLTNDEVWLALFVADWRQGEGDAEMWVETLSQAREEIARRLGPDALERASQWAVDTRASALDLVNTVLDRFPGALKIGSDDDLTRVSELVRIDNMTATEIPHPTVAPRTWLPEPSLDEHKALLKVFADIPELIRAAGYDAVAEESGIARKDVQRVARNPLRVAGGMYDAVWRAAERVMLARSKDPADSFVLTLDTEPGMIDSNDSTTPPESPADGQNDKENEMSETDTITTPGPEFVEAAPVTTEETAAPAAATPAKGRVTKADGAKRAAELTTARGAKAKIYALTKEEFDAKVTENGGDLDATVKAVLAEAGIPLSA